uniref:Uncharacterized protein n=1 Tax=Rhizophora mucronata TaxID=61149 RepID=A0A2P2P8Z8_RHIMU
MALEKSKNQSMPVILATNGTHFVIQSPNGLVLLPPFQPHRMSTTPT